MPPLETRIFYGSSFDGAQFGSGRFRFHHPKQMFVFPLGIIFFRRCNLKQMKYQVNRRIIHTMRFAW